MNPKLRIVLAGFNEEHTEEFSAVVRDIMSGPEYKDSFPLRECQVNKPSSKDAFSTNARANLRDGQHSITAVGLLSGFTGRGADILIIDDPYASPDDARSKATNEHVWRWWTELAKVRINDNTHVIVMFHRYHEDDLAGRLLAEGGWEYLRFPAIADENEDGSDPTGRQPGELLSPIRSREFLKQFEERHPMVWLGHFQGRPRAAEGAFVRREWLKEISLAEVPPLKGWVRFWDLATKADQKGDYFSGALVGIGPNQTVYLRDVTRFRAEWPDAREYMAEITRRDFEELTGMGATYEVGVEMVVWMRTMTQDLMSLPIFQSVRLSPVRPSGDKKERASGWVARARNDMFRMVKGPWNEQFIAECLSFDGHGLTHDDQIDSVSGAYDLLWDLKGELIEVRKEPEVGSLAYYRELGYQRQREEYGEDWIRICHPDWLVNEYDDDYYY